MVYRIVLPILVSMVVLSSCSHTEQAAEVGHLRGTVFLYDVVGNKLAAHDGAQVQIEGTRFKSTSDATGTWQIDDIPAGIYDVIFTKPGYDTLIVPQIQFSGAGTQFLQENWIQAIPFDSIPIVSAVIDSFSSHHIDADSIYIYSFSLTATLNVMGPDARTLQYYQWFIKQPGDTASIYNSESTVSHIPTPFVFTYRTDQRTRPDTLYLQTRAVALPPGNSSPYSLPRTRSPYVSQKMILVR